MVAIEDLGYVVPHQMWAIMREVTEAAEKVVAAGRRTGALTVDEGRLARALDAYAVECEVAKRLWEERANSDKEGM